MMLHICWIFLLQRGKHANDRRDRAYRPRRKTDRWDTLPGTKSFNTVREICKEYGLQYILTLIDSDIPRDELDNRVAFPDEEIVLRLHDHDDSGRLFEMGF